MKRYIFILKILLCVLPLYTTGQNQNRPEVSKGNFLQTPFFGKSELYNNTIENSEKEIVFSEQILFGENLKTQSNWKIEQINSINKDNLGHSDFGINNQGANYNDNANDWLISPSIDLPKDSDVILLHYKERHELESGYDFGLVKISIDEGISWTTLSKTTGYAGWKESQIDITSFKGETVLFGFNLTSDDLISGEGWFLDDISIKSYTKSSLDVNILSVNSQNFPLIYLNIEIEDPSESNSILTEENFQILENSLIQSELFSVTPPETSEGQRLADIVFCVDVTGSMSDEINAVKTNMLSFVNALSASDIDYTIGFVSFGDIVHVYNDYNLYTDQSQILSIVNNIELGEHGIGSGGDYPENQLGAMAEGSKFNFRPGAQRIQIMITDATSHEANHVTPWTVQTLINNILIPNNIIVFPVFDVNQSDQRDQYIPIAETTNPNGTYFHVYDNFNLILNEISNVLGSYYVVRYKSSQPTCDEVLRNIEVFVSHSEGESFAQGSYMPCASPVINRTPETIALHEQAWAENTSFSMEVIVTDNFEPYVNTVNVFYKNTSKASYDKLSLVKSGTNTWAVNIPISSVTAPGFDYYFTASDGIHTISDPPTSPSLYPYQLAILPNVAPIINHNPVRKLIVGQSINIEAEVIDNTNQVTEIKLYYRKLGQLVYQSIDMVNVSDDLFSGIIPENYSVSEGVEYYISAWDDFGVRTDHGSPGNPHYISESAIDVNSGGIYIQIVETAGTNVVDGTNVVKKVGYRYSYFSKPPPLTGSTTRMVDDIKRVPVDKNGFVFLDPYNIPDNATARNDFHNEILLFDEKDRQIGHIAFSYSFEWEGMNSRHAILFFHNDGPIFGGSRSDNSRYFPYHRRSPNNPTNFFGIKERYNYYKDGEYPVSMLVPPHFPADDSNPMGYRIPYNFIEQPLLFIHGLTGSFSYQEKFGAEPHSTKAKGDQVSYWYHSERIVNSFSTAKHRKFHAWQYYYPNEDDLKHCGMMLREAINFLYPKYKQKIGLIAHSMGGLVTLEFLTTNTPDYNRKKISKFLISQTPSHGSLGANRAYLDGAGKIAWILKMDRKAPCYRDMSIGSGFLYDLHSRDWNKLLDFNSSRTIEDNVFVVFGLTDKDFRKADLKDIVEVNLVHTEALDHDDGIVSFSSVSLLDKGIGLAGFYGNHDDGKFNATTSDFLIPKLVDNFFNAANHQDFLNFCLSNESFVEVLINGEKTIIKPAGDNNMISNLIIDRPRVVFQKGMVTLESDFIDDDNLYLFRRVPNFGIIIPNNKDFILSPRQKGPSDLNFYYQPLGRFFKNEYIKGINRFVFSEYISIKRGNTGFAEFSEFPLSVSLTYIDRRGNATGFGSIGSFYGNYLNYNSVTIDNEGKGNPLATESSPVKDFLQLVKSDELVAEVSVDNQTSLAEFYLYSQYANYNNLAYYLTLYNPIGELIDSTTINTQYIRSQNSGLINLTVLNPMPGSWKVVANYENDEHKDNYNFIAFSRFSSEIKAEWKIEQRPHFSNSGIIETTAFLEVPNIERLIINDLSSYLLIDNGKNIRDTLFYSHYEVSDSNLILHYQNLKLPTGDYHYDLIIDGIYDNYRFERAIDGSFTVEDFTPYISIPDQELNFIESSKALRLENYIDCKLCDYENLLLEVKLDNTTFLLDNFYFNHNEESNVLTIHANSLGPNAEAYFSVFLNISDTIIVNDSFHIRFTASDTPRHLSVSDITRNEALLHWVPSGNEDSWEILYGLSGFNPVSQGTLVPDIKSFPFRITNLTGSTNYDFYVRPVFDEESKSGSWSWPGSFITAHQIKASGGSNGRIEPEGEIELLDGMSKAFEIIPETNYRISKVFIDGVDVGNISQYTFESVRRDHTIYAEFSINSYKLIYLTTAGGVITGDYNQSVVHGSNGTPVEAIPNTGYHFVQWSDGSTTNPRTDISVMSDITVTAIFEVAFFEISAAADPPHGGTIPGMGSFMAGSNINLVAIPSSGYHFFRWTEEGQRVYDKAIYNFTVDKNRNLTAHFVDRDYILLSSYEAESFFWSDFEEVSVIADMSWQATPSHNWISVYPNYGSKGQNTVMISWLDNPSASQRIGNVIFQNENAMSDYEIIQHGTALSGGNITKEKIIIYPNPVHDRLHIKGLPAGSSFYFTNIHGNIVFRQEQTREEMSVSLQGLSPGFYNLIVVTHDRRIVKKIILF